MTLEVFVFICISTGILLMLINKTRRAGKIILTITLSLYALIGSFLLYFDIAWMYPNEEWSIVTTWGAIFAALAATIYLLWSKIRRKKIYITLIVSSILCLCPLAGVVTYHIYIENIPVVYDSEFIYYEYSPYYENSKVVSLSEESVLKIEDDLPSMDGAIDFYPAYAAFAKAIYPFEVLDDENIFVCTSSSTAYEKLINGEVDIIFVPSASQEQLDAALAKGVEMTFTPVAKEAFVFFVNSKNSLEGLTIAQIQRLYSGEYTEWSDFGINKLGSIRAYQRDEGSSSQNMMLTLMDGRELMTPLMEDRNVGFGKIYPIIADYKNYKNALGYTFRFYTTEFVKNNQTQLLSINGVYPSDENIINGTYPFCINYYAVTTQNSNPKCADILEWIQSEQGQYLIEQNGYVGLK